MITQEPHPMSGKRVQLKLSRTDPARRLYSGLDVEVVDWADRAVGLEWDRQWRTSSSAPKDRYLNRVTRAGVKRSDRAVVAVQPTAGPLAFVHESELGAELT